MKASECHAAFRTLPRGGLTDIVKGRAIILAPHPDDESLGCGGLIAASCEAGNPPLLVILTDGAGSHPKSRLWSADQLRVLREAETLRAVAHLGLSPHEVRFFRHQDTQLPVSGTEFDNIVADLRALAAQEGCSTIVAPWVHDPHCDHEAAWLIGSALAHACDLTLRAYPVWGWTIAPDTEVASAPVTGWSLDISAFVEHKRRAIDAHDTQLGRVITDDSDGFVLADTFIAFFSSDTEVYLQS